MEEPKVTITISISDALQYYGDAHAAYEVLEDRLSSNTNGYDPLSCLKQRLGSLSIVFYSAIKELLE